MSHLARTAAQFQDHVLTGNRAIEGEIDGPGAQFRDARLGIYRDAYRLRLIEILGADYKALRTYLGEEPFAAMAREYLAAHPSTFRNVRWFGGSLAEFLRGTPAYAERPVLAELAQFEWTLGLAFDAADAAQVAFEEVAAVAPQAWAGLRFAAHPALHLIELRTNAVAIWKEVDEKDSFGVAVSDIPVTWAIWRNQYSPFFRSLEIDEAWALKAVRDGADFGAICEGLCAWIGEAQAAARAAGLLRGWIEAGWIAQLLIGN
jgi:hypothetical protein